MMCVPSSTVGQGEANTRAIKALLVSDWIGCKQRAGQSIRSLAGKDDDALPILQGPPGFCCRRGPRHQGNELLLLVRPSFFSSYISWTLPTSFLLCSYIIYIIERLYKHKSHSYYFRPLQIIHHNAWIHREFRAYVHLI